MSNSLSTKYLSEPKVVETPRYTGNNNQTLANQGYLGYLFIAVGVYYCSAIDQFGESEDGIMDPIIDGSGRTWRLVTSEYVEWMAGMVRMAFESEQVSGADLSAAILKLHRVRERLELELAKASGVALQSVASALNDSDGVQHSLGGVGGTVSVGGIGGGELLAADTAA